MSSASHPFLHTYRRYPLTLVRGEGHRVQDDAGRWYLDACTGIAVQALGHNHPRVTRAIQDQLSRISHTSNLFSVPVVQELAALVSRTFDDGAVFFTNSGVEANEAAVKLVRKHWWRQGRPDKDEILVLDNAFHGRTLLGITMTPKAPYQEGFGPLVPGIRAVPVDTAAAHIGPRTAAIVLEPVQGEGGCRPVPHLDAIRAACDREGALLVYDEIQCGLGRKGVLLQQPRPDIVTMAKAIGGGLPLGVMVALRPDVQEGFAPGDHGSTFGGNPVSCAAGKAVLEVLLEQRLWANCAAMGDRLMAGLRAAGAPEVTGKGLLVAARCGRENGPVLAALRARGVLTASSGADGIRFLPPFTITAGEIDELVEAFAGALADTAV